MPFVAYAEPSGRKLHFRSSLGERASAGDEYFFLSKFAASPEEIIKIPFVADAAMTVAALDDAPTGICGVKESVFPESTDKETYMRGAEEIIRRLNLRGGKTVYSRVICGDDPGVDWVTFAKAYFEALPLTYRFIYYTPETGAWIVATPELLFHYSRTSRTAFSMALAGTRKADAGADWDEKNKEEHGIVSRYVADVMNQQGLSPEVCGPVELSFGPVEHLCTSFTVHGVELSDDKVFDVISSLSPTPALAGYPLQEALDDIRQIETHPRDCYGGFIGLCTEADILAVVNLRCLRFSGSKYCLYAGGGLMPGSVAAMEWEETEAKTSVASNILKQIHDNDNK